MSLARTLDRSLECSLGVLEPKTVYSYVDDIPCVEARES